MLSYQHIYHAGNLADVQKHYLLASMLDYLTGKEKPFSYIETHSGRGVYQLDAVEAVKTGEAQAGVGRVLDKGRFDPGTPYARALSQTRETFGPMAYPGSPMIASAFTRIQDSMHLAELHPQEYRALSKTMRPLGAKTYFQDGFELAQSLLPPNPRRGLLLIDPSYEVKADYDRLPGIITSLHRKWNVGIIALWYPILTDDRHKTMCEALLKRHFPKVLHHEVSFRAARDGPRMIGSGMFVINATFAL